MDLRRLLSGAAYLTLASVFGRALGLISFPILTHFVAPAAYGIAALVTSMLGILTVFGVAGQDTSLMRNYFDSANYSAAEVETFIHRFALLSGLTFGVIGGLGWMAYVEWASVDTSPLVALILAVTVLLTTISTFGQAVARLEGRYARLSIATVLTGICGLVITVTCALIWRTDEVALLLAGLAQLVMVLMLPMRSIWSRDHVFSLARSWQMMRVGLPMLAVAPGFWVIVSSDRWFLAAETSMHEVGIYLVAVTIATLGQIVTSVLVSVWNPELYRNLQGTEVKNTHRLRQVLTVILWAILTAWFGLALFGEVLIMVLAADEFQSAARYVPWLALGYMIYGVNQFFGFGFMIHNRTGLIPGLWVVGIACSLTLNFLLIPQMQAYGAVIAQIASFLTVALLTWAISYRWTPFQPHWGSLFMVFGLFLALVLLEREIVPQLSLVAGLALRGGLAVIGIGLSGYLIQRQLDPFRLGRFSFGRRQEK